MVVTFASGVARAQTVCDVLIPVALVPPAGGFEPGCGIHRALERGPVSGAGGYYVTLEYPACADGPCAGLTGASKFVCEAASGYSPCLGVPGPIPPVVGHHAGPFGPGMDQRFAGDTDTRAGICFSDYAGNGARLGVVPVIEPVASGAAQARVAGFAWIFLTAPVPGNGDLTVEFVAGPTALRSTTWGRTKILYR